MCAGSNTIVIGDLNTPTLQPVVVPTPSPSQRTFPLLQVNISFILTHVLTVDVTFNDDIKQSLIHLVCGGLDLSITNTCESDCINNMNCLQIVYYNPSVNIYRYPSESLLYRRDRELQTTGDDNINDATTNLDEWVMSVMINMNVTVNANDFLTSSSQITANSKVTGSSFSAGNNGTSNPIVTMSLANGRIADFTAIDNTFHAIKLKIANLSTSNAFRIIFVTNMIGHYAQYFQTSEVQLVKSKVSLSKIVSASSDSYDGPSTDTDDVVITGSPTMTPSLSPNSTSQNSGHSSGSDLTTTGVIWLTICIVLLLLLPVVAHYCCSLKRQQGQVLSEEGSSRRTHNDLEHRSCSTVCMLLIWRCWAYCMRGYRETQIQRTNYVVPLVASISSNATFYLHSISHSMVTYDDELTNVMPGGQSTVRVGPSTTTMRAPAGHLTTVQEVPV